VPQGISGGFQPDTEENTSGMETTGSWAKTKFRHKGRLQESTEELKQGNKKDQPKVAKKGETFGKDKVMAIIMVQPWQRVARKRVTQSFSLDPKISFPPLGDEDGVEGPMVIEAEIGGHFIYRIYAAKQKDCPTRMHDGLRTESTAFAIIQAAEERIKVAINPEYPEQIIAIGSILREEGRKALCGLLRRNLYVFAWKPKDMTGVPRHIVEHRLNIREGCPPVRQKKRSQAPERNKTIK
nr:reverse transcriptase domain-containing protein [Tanacetum cinerariifolium]